MTNPPGTTPPPDSADDPAACAPYLWDRSLPVDAEVERLERSLQPLRSRGGFAGVEQAASSRRVLVVRRTALALAAILLIGVGIGWWWAGRPVTDNGELSPWKFVAGRGVRVGRVRVDDMAKPGFRVRITTNNRTELYLHTPGGGEAAVRPGSGVSFFEGLPGFRPSSPALWFETGACVVSGGASNEDIVVAAGYSSIPIKPGMSVSIDDISSDSFRILSLRGDVDVNISRGKATEYVRLSPTMTCYDRKRDHRPEASALVIASSSSEQFIKAIGGFQSVRRPAADRSDELKSVLATARSDDAGVLWNLAFGGGAFHRIEDSEREQVVSRLGQLLNRWPPSLKTSKEPFWSPTFAEDWWTIIRESAANPAGKDGDAKAAPPPPAPSEEAAALKKKDEADKRAAEQLKQPPLDKSAPPPPPPPRKGGK